MGHGAWISASDVHRDRLPSNSFHLSLHPPLAAMEIPPPLKIFHWIALFLNFWIVYFPLSFQNPRLHFAIPRLMLTAFSSVFSLKKSLLYLTLNHLGS